MRIYATPESYKPIAPVKCSSCGSSDVVPMPVIGLIDRLAWRAFRAPFKCRGCHATLYRRVVKLVLDDDDPAES